MVSRRRQGLSLTVLMLAGVAVVATSPRRWGLAGPPMNGLFELNTAHPTATQRFHLALPAAPNVAGHQVTFSLRVTVPRAPGVTVTGTGASLVTFQSPASGGDLQGEVSTSVACPAQAPCEATLSVTATAAAPGSGTTTLPWSVTPKARGTGEDPPRGVRLATEEVP